MNKELKITSNAFIFYKDRLLLIKHKKTGKWMHVGGHLEGNESPEEGLEREVGEEVNLKIVFLEKYNYLKTDFAFFKESPKPFYIHQYEKDSYKGLRFDFLCLAENPKDLKIQEDEIVDYKWFSKEELEKASYLFEPVKMLALKAFNKYQKLVLTK